MRAEKCIVQFVYKGNIIFELYNTQNTGTVNTTHLLHLLFVKRNIYVCVQ